MPTDSTAAGHSSVLAPLQGSPGRSALLTDIDGTLAPIAELPELARVPAEAAATLAALSRRYGVVGCVSGRRALEARQMVGVGEIAYAGNHGLELLLPGDDEPRRDPKLAGNERLARDFLGAEVGLGAAGLRVEDKGPIQALHWRGSEDPEAAERRALEVAERARAAGLEPHRGRMVLELRPPGSADKGAAVEALISAAEGIAMAAYAGDDRTDLDAFRRLRGMRETGRLQEAVCIGVTSPEGPPEISEQSDLSVAGPAEWLEILRSLTV